MIRGINVNIQRAGGIPMTAGVASGADGGFFYRGRERAVSASISRGLSPGTVLQFRNESKVVLARRKEDDSGWWMTDGSGLADRVIDAENSGWRVDTMSTGQREALYEIIRQASYLPLHSQYRVRIENAASQALRELRGPPAAVSSTEESNKP